jgi:ubiquinone/menaquinone biosynthesis C-methylase UbiE
MLLNRFEYLLMNNPLRAAVQRRFEAPRLLEMGGAETGGAALEIGCGQGVGAELILDLFGVDSVEAFDLDPRMVSLARRRLAAGRRPARFWVGSATSIPAVDESYEAVFDFGILHHVRDWPRALAEVARILKPGGRFYAEEVLEPFIRRTRWLLEHPRADRFDADEFRLAIEESGLAVVDWRQSWGWVGWYAAVKPVPP